MPSPVLSSLWRSPARLESLRRAHRGQPPDSQTSEIQIRVALMNCFSALGTAEIIRVAAKLITEWDRLERQGFAVGGWRPNDSGGVDTERLVFPG